MSQDHPTRKLQWGLKARPKSLRAGQYSSKSCRQAVQRAQSPSSCQEKRLLLPGAIYPTKWPERNPGKTVPCQSWASAGALCPPVCCSSRYLQLCCSASQTSISGSRKPEPPYICSARIPGHRAWGRGSKEHEALGSFFLPAESDEDRHCTKLLHLLPSHLLSCCDLLCTVVVGK